MASLKQKNRDFGIACDGGLQHTEQFFGLRDNKDFDPSSDVVFVSIDLEVSKQEISKSGLHLSKNLASQLSTLDI